MIEDLVYKYIEKNYSLIPHHSLDVWYIHENENGEKTSRHQLFSEIKLVFHIIDENEFLDVYLKWVNKNKKVLV